MTAEGSPVELGIDALNRLLDQDVMRALVSPESEVPGASDMAMRLAEFWNVIDIVKTSAGRQFRSRADADTALFEGATGGGFGIRQALRATVVDLLTPVEGATLAAGEGQPQAAPATSAAPSLDAKTVSQGAQRLGNYVYVLVDPRDARACYVGDVLDHRVRSSGG